MKKIIDFFADEEKRSLVFLIISGGALLMSLFHIGMFGMDGAWVAIVLCGLPILKGAIEGLLHGFDIKADLLVSIALVAAVFIGEIFVAIILAMAGILNPVTGALVHNIGSVFVIINSALLLNFKNKWHTGDVKALKKEVLAEVPQSGI